MSTIVRATRIAAASIAALTALATIAVVEALGTSAPAPVVIAVGIVVGCLIGGVAHIGVARPLLSALVAEHATRSNLERDLVVGRQRRTFVEQLDAAVEMADTEDQVLQIVARAVGVLTPERENSLLLAIADEPRVSWSVDAGESGLGVPVRLGRAERCSALTTGRATYHESTGGLDACPHCSDLDWEMSSVCVPIAVGDGHLAVMHSIGPVGELPEAETQRVLELVARRAGGRIGALRAARQHTEHVALDPLTKLPNHTVVHGRLRTLFGGDEPFALAFCDLDDFSSYNERHGSDAGDTALRLYAEVMSATLRPGDIIARYAGDRFLCLFPNCSAEHAASAMERVRESLVLELSLHEIDPFTTSVGVVDSTDGTCVEDLLESADVTLSVAKHSGGNRVSRAKFNSIGN